MHSIEQPSSRPLTRARALAIAVISGLSGFVVITVVAALKVNLWFLALPALLGGLLLLLLARRNGTPAAHNRP